jgi:(R)-2-hydroxyacyl-CoA dehydratese activating ATPase
MLALGIDVGSLSAEAVLIDETREVLASVILPTGSNSRRAGEAALAAVLAKSGRAAGDIGFTVATGYGRISLEFAGKQVTEITCHARGIHQLRPGTRTLIDIGGQDSKAIRLSPKGRVLDFIMNDKCAAGTGRFLEVMAAALEVKLEELAGYGARAGAAVPISSMCTVFAESEVVSLLAAAHPRENIIRGIHEAIALRTAGMLRRIGLEEPLAMSGGVAKNSGVVRALEKELGCSIYVPEEPQIVGALGAALLALEALALPDNKERV